MVKCVDLDSRTFADYLLLPGLTRKRSGHDPIDLRTPLVKFDKGKSAKIYLNIPFASAMMQSVSDHTMAISLARQGGIAFIYCSQAIDDQASMVRAVKNFKAGFVISDTNVTSDTTIREAMALVESTGHSTIAVTHDGSAHGVLLGMLHDRNLRLSRIDPASPVSDHMSPVSSSSTGDDGITIQEANDILWERELDHLPIVGCDGRLRSIVFRKDYIDHKSNPVELTDSEKRLIVGAGINTHDYRDRAPALIEAGADVLCVDSSDGYSEWQAEAIQFVKNNYGDNVLVGGGNVVHGEAFAYLAGMGVDFIKVGIGGGAICITREQKGIGRGQASAVMDVSRRRDEYYAQTGSYVPICSDGGISQDYHIGLALAMGADFVMMGRYFARFDESPGRIRSIDSTAVKEYWGEGTKRSNSWQRYSDGELREMIFEEGSDEYVPYAGKMSDVLPITLAKIRSMMANVGVASLAELRQAATFVRPSVASIREGGLHDVILKRMQRD